MKSYIKYFAFIILASNSLAILSEEHKLPDWVNLSYWEKRCTILLTHTIKEGLLPFCGEFLTNLMNEINISPKLPGKNTHIEFYPRIDGTVITNIVSRFPLFEPINRVCSCALTEGFYTINKLSEISNSLAISYHMACCEELGFDPYRVTPEQQVLIKDSYTTWIKSQEYAQLKWDLLGKWARRRGLGHLFTYQGNQSLPDTLRYKKAPQITTHDKEFGIAVSTDIHTVTTRLTAGYNASQRTGSTSVEVSSNRIPLISETIPTKGMAGLQCVGREVSLLAKVRALLMSNELFNIYGMAEIRKTLGQAANINCGVRLETAS